MMSNEYIVKIGVLSEKNIVVASKLFIKLTILLRLSFLKCFFKSKAIFDKCWRK